jgi:aspartyl protease family protein
MWKQVAPLFVIAVLIGWFMPAPDPAAPQAEPKVGAAVTPSPAAPASAQQSTKAWNDAATQQANAVVLPRQSDGHFYAEGAANGAPVRFLVDTGASVVALNRDDAQRLGLSWHPGELSTIGRGANGDVIGKAVMLDQLQIGGLTAQNVQAVIIPEGLDVSLLGQSFLSQVGNVSISGDKMTLKN